MEFCREIGALYIDTVAEPWKGFYFDKTLGPRSARTTRCASASSRRAASPGRDDRRLLLRRQSGHGLVVREGGAVNIAADTGLAFEEPKTREDWAALMQRVGVKGIHIAERDTQRAREPRPFGVFVNTWSVEGFISEGCSRPSSAGARTRSGCPRTPIGTRRLQGRDLSEQPGAEHRVRSWTRRPRRSTASSSPTTRRSRSPTTSPCARAKAGLPPDLPLRLSSLQRRRAVAARDVRQRPPQEKHHILDEHEIVDGIDELGVLLYGHERNAYWFGSQLSIEETRRARALPERDRAAGDVGGARRHGLGAGEPGGRDRRGGRDRLQALPRSAEALSRAGHRRTYTDWTPLDGPPRLLPEDIDTSDPWQFRNSRPDLLLRGAVRPPDPRRVFQPEEISNLPLESVGGEL
jgi:homospermidine synthase